MQRPMAALMLSPTPVAQSPRLQTYSPILAQARRILIDRMPKPEVGPHAKICLVVTLACFCTLRTQLSSSKLRVQSFLDLPYHYELHHYSERKEFQYYSMTHKESEAIMNLSLYRPAYVQEVLVVEDENGEVVKEHLKDVEVRHFDEIILWIPCSLLCLISDEVTLKHTFTRCI